MDVNQAHEEAIHLIEQALGEVLDGDDAIPTLSRAIAALKIEAGELPADELDDARVLPCTCQPEVRARGGFSSSCLLHSVRWEDVR